MRMSPHTVSRPNRKEGRSAASSARWLLAASECEGCIACQGDKDATEYNVHYTAGLNAYIREQDDLSPDNVFSIGLVRVGDMRVRQCIA